MISIRGGRGLGDALYVRPVVEHFVRLGEQVAVRSDYADVFVGSGAKVEPFCRPGATVVAHYVSRKQFQTNQWEDVCISAGVPGLELSFRWEVKNHLLARDLLAMAKGRPIVMVNGGRPPMNRADGFGDEMLPRRAAFDAVLDALREAGCFLVEVGKGAELYPLTADVDLADRTTVSDLLDIAWIAHGLVGQCSFMIPLAEAFDKPLLVVWASRGLVSKEPFIRQCRPEKILSKATSRFVMDDWPVEQIQEVARDALCSVA